MTGGHGHEETTGTSAVNADGEVIVFCDLPHCHLDNFTISGRELAFFEEDMEAPLFSAVFGSLTVEAAKRGGSIVVCFLDGPARYERVEARHGL